MKNKLNENYRDLRDNLHIFSVLWKKQKMKRLIKDRFIDEMMKNFGIKLTGNVSKDEATIKAQGKKNNNLSKIEQEIDEEIEMLLEYAEDDYNIDISIFEGKKMTKIKELLNERSYGWSDQLKGEQDDYNSNKSDKYKFKNREAELEYELEKQHTNERNSMVVMLDIPFKDKDKWKKMLNNKIMWDSKSKKWYIYKTALANVKSRIKWEDFATLLPKEYQKGGPKFNKFPTQNKPG